MGKKRSRKTYVSKGQRVNVRPLKGLTSEIDKMLNKVRAWKKGQNPWISIPSKDGVAGVSKIRSNTLWGNPKEVGGIHKF